MTTAFVVGAGPSLTPHTERLQRLHEHGLVIAANDSYKHCQPHAVVSLDRHWLKNRWGDIPGMPVPVKYMAHEGYPREPLDNLEYLDVVQGSGLSAEGPYINGLCSGHMAMQYAYRMGATTIYLLGIDLKHAGTHFHDGYPWGQSGSTSRYYPRWAQRFDECAEQFDEAGVQVLNCSPDSAVTAYPFRALEDVL